ncbi:DUF1028 domain-containing protein [bacterium]|nr:DUF1028 domain-containing protein [bacterium]MCI0605716.1 DUF1028 domain-containing protein [bacterium]
MKLAFSLLLIIIPSFVSAEIPDHTYSIVARDPDSGELGVAVQTHWFAVGSRVPWAEAGVGAVATQSFTEVSYGPLGLELMKSGKSAPDALKSLIASDKSEGVRQVAMIDSNGNVAAHTGKKCIEHAGHKTGSNYSVQANMMEKPTVWAAMAQAFEAAKGDLADRMLAALEAAQKEGGDVRGKQSAAIIVVSANKTGLIWKNRQIDLRVDDHPEPLQELRRLLQLHRAYRHMDKGDDLLAEKRTADGMKEYELAMALQPQNEEMIFWAAIGMFTAGEESRAINLLRPLFRAGPRWLELLGRLPAAGVLTADAAERIRKQSQP